MLNLGIQDNSTEANKDYSWDEEKVNSLRQRILSDETLHSRTDDMFLLSFLRARKFDEDEAFNRIKLYYKIRKKNPEIFTNMTYSAVENFLEVQAFGYSKETDGDGRVLLYLIGGRWDPSKAAIRTALKAAIMFIDMLLTDHLLQANGAVLIVDCKRMRWKELLEFNPSFMYTLSSCMFGNYPLTYKQWHLVNAKKIVYWFLVTILPCLPSKLKEKIFIHQTGLESLHSIISPKYLSCDFGGDLPAFDPSECNEKLRENEEFFKENETYWNNEN